MKRRNLLALFASASATAAPSKPSIQLHTDLHVKLEEEQQLLDDFQRLFLPRVRKAKGFIDANLIKFQKANVGKAPDFLNYRLVQIFQSEELREKWSLHPDHKIAWHTAIESHVKTPFVAYLYEVRSEGKATR